MSTGSPVPMYLAAKEISLMSCCSMKSLGGRSISRSAKGLVLIDSEVCRK